MEKLEYHKISTVNGIDRYIFWLNKTKWLTSAELLPMARTLLQKLSYFFAKGVESSRYMYHRLANQTFHAAQNMKSQR